MFTIIFRAIIIYVIVLFMFRLMGKRQLGEMQPFELVLTLIITDLATIPMADISIPVLHGIIPLLTLVVMHFIITILTKISPKLASFISGKPVIVINPDGIDDRALKELNITVDDLFEAIRSKGYFNLEQIHYAIMETNGNVNVLPKSDQKNIENSGLPVILISEGMFMKENAEIVNITKEHVERILKKEKIQAIKDCLVLTINNAGYMYVQANNGKCKVIDKPKGVGL